jgi:hypothetical protein
LAELTLPANSRRTLTAACESKISKAVDHSLAVPPGIKILSSVCSSRRRNDTADSSTRSTSTIRFRSSAGRLVWGKATPCGQAVDTVAQSAVRAPHAEAAARRYRLRRASPPKPQSMSAKLPGSGTAVISPIVPGVLKSNAN